VNKPPEPPNKLKPRTCKCCGGVFYRTEAHTSSINCPDCAHKRRKITTTIGELDTWKNGKSSHPAWRYGKIRNVARYHNQDLCKSSCAICGYDKHVEIDHIKPISSFAPDALLIDVNSRKNLIQLCRNCHWERQNGLISDERIKIAQLKNGAIPGP
jgi:5-methylcytosine-specific restriction endonuclease McrA